MFMLKKRNLMDDFGGTQKYLVAKDLNARGLDLEDYEFFFIWKRV